MKYLLTQIDAHTEDDEDFIFTRGRSSDGKRVEVGYFGFLPRFFAKDEDIRAHIKELKASGRVVAIGKSKKVPNSIYGDPVGEIRVKTRKDVHGGGKGICDTILAECETFQSRIPYQDTWMYFTGVKSGIEINGEPDYMLHGIPMYNYKRLVPHDDLESKLKIAPLDIETYFFRGDDPSVDEAKLPLIAISFKCFDRKTIDMYCYNPNEKPVKEIIKTKLEGATKLKYKMTIRACETEKGMLNTFIDDFVKEDPDLSTAWNSNYDFGYIINRCKNLKVDVRRLSPWSHFIGYPVYVKNDVPYIRGRTIMDELNVYKEHMKFEGIPAFPSLQYTSMKELGAGKVSKRHPETNKLRTTGQLCDDDYPLLIRYNAIDTELVELIAKQRGLWDYLERLRRNCGIPLEKSLTESVFLHALYVRRANALGMAYATRDYEKARKFTYEGGLVLDPKPGIYKAVCSYDFKALYANVISAWNMSLETLIQDPTKEPMSYLETCYKTPNGLYFKPKKEQVGFVAGLIDELIADGDATKAEWLKAFDKYGHDDPRVESLSLEYDYKKSMRNSVYGTFKFYNVYIAEAIAAVAREAQGTAAKYALRQDLLDELHAKYGWKGALDVIYGDTDSGKIEGLDIYNRPSMVFIGEWISDQLDSVCQKYNVPDNKFLYRPEEVYDQYFLMDKKKCYSGHVIAEYKETIGGAVWRDTDKFQIVGHEKSDISIIGNEAFELLQKDCCRSAREKFDLWLQMSQQIQHYKKVINNRFTPLYKLCPTVGIKRKMESYGWTDKYGRHVGTPAHVKAALWSNEHLKTNYGRGSKIPKIPVKGMEMYIALPEDWEDAEMRAAGLEVDRKRVFKDQIYKKFKPVADVLGFNMKELMLGARQEKMGRLR